jgi:hypothetical protein
LRRSARRASLARMNSTGGGGVGVGVSGMPGESKLDRELHSLCCKCDAHVRAQPLARRPHSATITPLIPDPPPPDGTPTAISSTRPAATGAAQCPLTHRAACASRGLIREHPVTLADDTDDGFPEEEPFTFTCGPDERLSTPLRSRTNQQITAADRRAARPADRRTRSPAPGR